MTSNIGVEDEFSTYLSDEVRQELAKYEQVLTASRGSSLVQCGVPPEHLIILNSGSVETMVQVGGRTLSLGVAGPGRVLALYAILSGEAPQASVTCLEECRVTLLPKKAFLDVLRRNPRMYFAIAKMLSTDLVNAQDVIRDHGRGRKSKVLRNAFRLHHHA